jgi:iron complex transport system permease protein
MDIEWMRVLLAFFCGYFLTLSGSLSQIVTNNKLASSSTLGFDGLAVLMVLSGQFLITFLHVSFPLESLSFIIFCFFFFAISLFSKKIFRNKTSDINQKMQKIILIGLGFNLFIGGIFSVIQFLFISINYEFPTGIWFGNFKFYEISTLVLFSIVFILSYFYILKLSKDMSFLALGNNFARGLGVDVNKLIRHSLLLSLFFTGLVVSYFGVFSFIGLIFPHILRTFKIFKYSMRNEMIYGSVIAGILLTVIDLVCYLFPFLGAEIPVGMVCSVMGSFILLYLLNKKESI